jgi:hypothetical protein
MGGDYSRQTFDPKKHYSRVLMQQGRVQLDSDWNEQGEILHRRWSAETTDIVGRCGVPRETPDGFKIEVHDGALTIGQGRIYVHGLLAENHGKQPWEFEAVLAEERGTAVVAYADQPYFPNVAIEAPRPETAGRHLVYLDVWSREVTFLEDSRVIEKAVGVDTTARYQTVWQVKVLPNVGTTATCVTADDEIPGWLDRIQPSAGRLSTAAVVIPGIDDPCLLPPSAGFRGLENQLYRVEIHDSGAPGTATFKWSRDNASVATTVIAIPASDTLRVTRTSWDSLRRFSSGDWVEITDDWREFAGQRGELRRIEDVDDATMTITLAEAIPLAPQVGGFDSGEPGGRHTRIRRWDQKGKVRDSEGNEVADVDVSSGVVPIPGDDTAIILEDGVQITFHLDPDPGLPLKEFRNGDYWVFAARTADASVEQLQQATPRGVHHHHCRLALLEITSAGELTVLSDCRQLFAPLTETIASEPGIHITDIRLVSPETVLHNDTNVPVSHLVAGVNVVCDEAVDPLTISQATCSVTLDVPCTDQQLWGDGGTPTALHPVIGFRRLILSAEVSAIDNRVSWKPTGAASSWLTGRLIKKMVELQLGKMVLARLTLNGNFIFSPANPELYLDGDTFGLPQSGGQNTALRLPSGDRMRGGEFQMWFWLVQEEIPEPVGLASLTLNPTTVVAGASVQAVVTLSGSAPGGGFLVVLSSRNPAIAAVAASVTVAAGTTSAPFQVTTTQVADRTQVEITASSGNVSLKAMLTVQPQTSLLKVNRVRILSTGVSPSNPNPSVLATMTSPSQPLVAKSQSNPNAIEVQLTGAVDAGSVVSGASFIVSNAPGATLNGVILFVPGNNTVRWVLTVGQSLPPGNYSVRLKGTGSSVITARGVPLDGEPTALPSGNNVPGGDFSFSFSVSLG